MEFLGQTSAMFSKIAEQTGISILGKSGAIKDKPYRCLDNPQLEFTVFSAGFQQLNCFHQGGRNHANFNSLKLVEGREFVRPTWLEWSGASG